MKPICFLFLSVTRINPCLKQQRYQKKIANDSLYCSGQQGSTNCGSMVSRLGGSEDREMGGKKSPTRTKNGIFALNKVRHEPHRA